MRHPARPIAAALAVCLGLAGGARAAVLKVDYSITLEGLTLGSAGLDGTFDDRSYDLKLRGHLTGLAGVFSGQGQGGATARGVISGPRLSSTGFSASARSGSNQRTVQIGVNGGNVTSITINPPFQEEPVDRVPLTEAALRGITDPLSGVVALAANPATPNEPGNCDRTVPVFDGTQRFNVVLSYQDTRVVRKGGFTGSVLVCGIRYVPVAGHRTDRPSVRFMEENRDMSVWLAPVPGTRMLVPLRISVRTMLGTSVVEAQRWEVSGAGR
jgi:hypothetical protein